MHTCVYVYMHTCVYIHSDSMVCCSGLQCINNVLRRVAGMLQWVLVCCSGLYCTIMHCAKTRCDDACERPEQPQKNPSCTHTRSTYIQKRQRRVVDEFIYNQHTER